MFSTLNFDIYYNNYINTNYKMSMQLALEEYTIATQLLHFTFILLSISMLWKVWQA